MWRTITGSLRDTLLSLTDLRIGGPLVVGLASALVALLSLVHLGSDVGEGETVRFEEWARAGLHAYASPAPTILMKAATALGSTAFLSVASLVVTALLVRAGRHRSAILFVVAMTGATLLNVVLKLAYQRHRPADALFDVEMPVSYSFPSGHTLLSTCFYGTLAVLLGARVAHRSQRMAVWALGAILSFAVGLSRIYLGVHYATDVIAGYLSAFIWVSVIMVADRGYRRLARAYQGGHWAGGLTTVNGSPS